MKKALRLPAFAKVNLRLHIEGQRADGYHELRTVFQTITLHDTLHLSLSSGRAVTLETDDSELPTGRDNLVCRAIEAMRRELRFAPGIHARLQKRIPVARGLGGGSGDAAAAIIGVMRIAEGRLPLERLVEIASALGADVPFFLFGGRAVGVGRGDEIYPLPDGPNRWLVVVSPHDIALSTREAYQWVSSELTNRGNAAKILAFCALCWSRQETPLWNDFEGPVFRRYPRLAGIRRALLRAGAAEAALAGSGSAVFGVFRNPAQARRAALGFPRDQVFVVETLNREKYARALHWRGGF